MRLNNHNIAAELVLIELRNLEQVISTVYRITRHMFVYLYTLTHCIGSAALL